MVTQHCKTIDSPKNFTHWYFTLQFTLTAHHKYCRHSMICNQGDFCLGISGWVRILNSQVFYHAYHLNSSSQILQNRRHVIKCNQWGFCLDISGYSTLENRRQSKEFHSLLFYLAIHPNSSSQFTSKRLSVLKNSTGLGFIDVNKTNEDNSPFACLKQRKLWTDTFDSMYLQNIFIKD